MRLRHRLLALFLLFAVVPLLAIGGFDYVHSERSLDALVESQTGVIAGRAAAALRDRLDLQESDIALLAGNDETQRVLRGRAARTTDSEAGAGAAQRLNVYLGELWTTLRVGYERVTLRDAAGGTLLVLEDPAGSDLAQSGTGATSVTRRILDEATHTPLGELELRPRVSELLRSSSLSERFGALGFTLLVDRDLGRVLQSGTVQAPPGTSLKPPLVIGSFRGERGNLSYRARGERRVASYVNFDSPAWTVLTTASVDEFAAPFMRQRLIDLGLLLGVVLVVSLGFFLLLRRSTRSLDQLAAAAGRVGQGDLSPALPPETTDEVGHLSAAFRGMASRVREMLSQVEASRQTAVLGRFAAELAHEIRNPLTSIKLNLQALERDSRDGRLPEESRPSVEMALREIRRLDQALRTALRAGRPAALAERYAVHAVLEDAVTLLRPEAAAQRVRIECLREAERDTAAGDAEAIKGALVNVLLNAIQAMPAGGTVSATTRNLALNGSGEAIELRIRDEGPGIPSELRERVFRPFFTTKEGGTGLGLSVALQTVQSQGGTLRLEQAVPKGAEVVLTIPVA
jgi:signal transduction histidine kinase